MWTAVLADSFCCSVSPVLRIMYKSIVDIEIRKRFGWIISNPKVQKILTDFFFEFINSGIETGFVVFGEFAASLSSLVAFAAW